MIDEVQRGGNDLILATKTVVDDRNGRGQFVLASSTRPASTRRPANARMSRQIAQLRWLAHRIAGPCAGTRSNPARWIGHSRRTRRHREVLRDRMPGVCSAST